MTTLQGWTREGRHRVAAFALVAGLLLAAGARAMSVSPIIVEMESAGARTRANVIVNNPGERTLSIEVETLSLAMAPDGKTSFTPDDEHLIVFPPVLAIGPGESQAVQILYVGDPELAASHSFRVSLLQVPVTLDDVGGSSLQVATNIHLLVNVAPPGASAALEVVSLEPGEAEARWVVTLRNGGNRHVQLNETRWEIATVDGERLELGPSDLARLVEGSLVLPNSTRTVVLRSPDGVDLAGARVSIVPDS